MIIVENKHATQTVKVNLSCFTSFFFFKYLNTNTDVE